MKRTPEQEAAYWNYRWNEADTEREDLYLLVNELLKKINKPLLNSELPNGTRVTVSVAEQWLLTSVDKQ